MSCNSFTSIADFTAALPGYQQRLDTIVQGVFRFIVENLNGDEAVESLGDMIDPGWAMGFAAGILNGLKDVLTNVFLIIFTMIFMLLEASSVQTKIDAAFGRSAQSLERPRIFLANLGRYLGIKTIVSVATGLLAGLLTWAIGVDFPLLWAMLAFLLNYVPTIGSIIAAVPAVLLALVQLGPSEATATAIGFAGINVIFGNYLEPRLMGYGVGISPLVVFIGLVFCSAYRASRSDPSRIAIQRVRSSLSSASLRVIVSGTDNSIPTGPNTHPQKTS